MTGFMNIFLVLLVSLLSVTSQPCDILENMSCQCHSSLNGESEQLICTSNKNEKNFQTDKIVRLTNQAKQISRTFDSFHLTFYDQILNIAPMFIHELSRLFPQSSASAFRGRGRPPVKISLAFPNFNQIHFQTSAFHGLFQDRSDLITALTIELTSNGQITFAPNAFNQLKVDQMSVHSSSLEPYTFEEIFNNTNIGELSMDGFTPRSSDISKSNFNGKIQSAKFTKMVELVSSEEFPNYPVRAMTIEAHEARRLNASSFSNYRNLHGIHLILPKFFFDRRSFEGFQYLPSLETIELDAETIKDNTFRHVSRIQSLILGPHLRYLTENSLEHLEYLKHLDLSKVTLDQLYPFTRCVLARYIDKQHRTNSPVLITPPQAEQCDCIYDFILAKLKIKAEGHYIDACENNQQERCQLSECDVVKSFRLSSSRHENIDQPAPFLPPVVETMIDTPVSFDSNYNRQSEAHRLPTYVHRHPSVDQQSIIDNADQSVHAPHPAIQISKTSALKVHESLDPNAIPTDDYYDHQNVPVNDGSSRTRVDSDEESYRLAMKNETYKWISLSLVCLTIISILLVGTLIWYFTRRSMMKKRKGEFQPVLTSPANV